ncbi:MAG: glutathione S-transferase, partial [Myxococcales bacterium]|nr:glutathione S-transferase [Myxococcales bacterium]
MITLYHAPNSRSSRFLWLLEELGQPYTTRIVSIRRGDDAGHPDPAYRKIQPHGKVPAIDHDGTIVFESSAIALYLADAFPEAKLGPPIGDPLRGAFVTWLAYYGGVMETDRASGRHASDRLEAEDHADARAAAGQRHRDVLAPAGLDRVDHDLVADVVIADQVGLVQVDVELDRLTGARRDADDRLGDRRAGAEDRALANRHVVVAVLVEQRLLIRALRGDPAVELEVIAGVAAGAV